LAANAIEFDLTCVMWGSLSETPFGTDAIAMKGAVPSRIKATI